MSPSVKYREKKVMILSTAMSATEDVELNPENEG
jgi:hypothetical protein